MKLRAASLALAAVLAGVCVFIVSSANHVPVMVTEAPASGGPRVEEQLRESLEVPEPAHPVTRGTPDVSLAPRLELSRGKLPWEEKIESVTGANNLAETAKVRRLLEMIPALPEHGLTTAAEEAVKRTTDADYNAVLLPVLANPLTHGMVQQVLFANLMERPDAIALPALLRIARSQGHPFAKYALENLNLLLRADYGADWLEWEAAIAASLASNRAEKQ